MKQANINKQEFYREILRLFSEKSGIRIIELSINSNPMDYSNEFQEMPLFYELKPGNPAILDSLSGRFLILPEDDYKFLLKTRDIEFYINNSIINFGYYLYSLKNYFMPMENIPGFHDVERIRYNMKCLRYRLFAPVFGEPIYPTVSNDTWIKQVFMWLDHDRDVDVK